MTAFVGLPLDQEKAFVFWEVMQMSSFNPVVLNKNTDLIDRL